ncbi:unnamed protein product [Arctogadus glacialis]
MARVVPNLVSFLSSLPLRVRALGYWSLVYGASLLCAAAALLRLWWSVLLRPSGTFQWSVRGDPPPACLNDTSLGTHCYVRIKESGLRFHYVAAGERGKPLMLFLHGFPEFWFSWRYQLREFKSEFRVVAVDMRGYGESDVPLSVESYRFEHLVTDVRDIVEYLGYNRCCLVGHDWGGTVAWLFSIHYPEMVTKLIVLNSPHPSVYAEEMVLRCFVDIMFKFCLLFFSLSVDLLVSSWSPGLNLLGSRSPRPGSPPGLLLVSWSPPSGLLLVSSWSPGLVSWFSTWFPSWSSCSPPGLLMVSSWSPPGLLLVSSWSPGSPPGLVSWFSSWFPSWSSWSPPGLLVSSPGSPPGLLVLLLVSWFSSWSPGLLLVSWSPPGLLVLLLVSWSPGLLLVSSWSPGLLLVSSWSPGPPGLWSPPGLLLVSSWSSWSPGPPGLLVSSWSPGLLLLVSSWSPGSPPGLLVSSWSSRSDYALRHPSQLLKCSSFFFYQLPRLPELMLSINDFKALKALFTSRSTGIGGKGRWLSSEDMEAYLYALSQPGALTGALNYYRNVFSSLPLTQQCVRSPVLLLWGECDAFLEQGMAEACRLYIRNHFRLNIISGAGHWLQQDQPDIVNTLMWTFIKEGEGRKSHRH